MSHYKRNILIFALFITLFCIGLYLCLFFNLDISIKTLVLSAIRIPAVIKAIVSGSCLALSGMILQTISKNPLADPYLTGLSSGAGLGIVLSIILFNSQNYSIFGFFGALISAVLVISLSGFSKFSITKLILIGLSLNLFTGSLISFLILLNPQKAYAMTLILTGGFSSADISNKLLVGIFIAVLLLTMVFIPKLNALRLDTKLIYKSQKQADFLNMIFIALASLLTSVSVFSAGILGFVGIICPLYAKLILGSDCRVLFFGNILIGSTLMLFSNFIANNLIYPAQIPLGIVIALVGTPFFVFFLLNKKINKNLQGGNFND